MIFAALPVSADTIYLLQHRELVAAEDSQKRLLDSLFFPDIRSRQEGIERAHRQTFEWIFDNAGNQVRPWHNFVDWLEKGHGTYWISGKAGAGKSTLMSFICQDSRTEAALRVWSGTNEVFIPYFFFWNPGTQLQKSLAGLLRSLIYQLVERFPDLVPVIISSMGYTQHKLQQLPTWTERRLCATLQHLLSHGLEKYRLCMFIDGLDEFHGDYDILLDMVKDLRQSTRVKFCVSSRPYQSFDDEFGSSAMLKLQDLTEPDIRRYVSDKLDRAPHRASHAASSSFKLKDTVDTIVQKAEGVFLWVNLAVRDQLEGFRNGDDAEQLRERLELLPEKIEELYGQMLLKIDKVHKKEVAQYLQLVLYVGRPSLFDVALAVHTSIDDIVLFSSDITFQDICEHCKSKGIRIATICKGFLEVQEDVHLHEWQKAVNDPSPEANTSTCDFSALLEGQTVPPEQREDLIETAYYRLRTRVDFLHRTAVDFFRDNKQGKNFLETNAPGNLNSLTSYIIKALLAGLVIFPVPAKGNENENATRQTIRKIMIWALYAEAETGVAQVALMDLVDRSLAILYQRSTGQPSNLHWCIAWNLESSQFSSSDGGKTTSRPFVDFLGFVAWWGLHDFVENTLDSQHGRHNSSILDYLLDCAVHGFGTGERGVVWKSHMKLISALLERGANPNLKTPEGTVWGSFLRQLCHGLYENKFNGAFEAADILDVLELGTIQNFLENGANVNEKVWLTTYTYTKDVVTHAGRARQMSYYTIDLEISALSFLHHFSARAPNLAKIEEAFVAPDALEYFECTNIYFEIGTKRVKSQHSKQQLRQVSHALDQHLKTFAGDPSKQRQVLHRQVVESFQEVNIEQLYEEACREDDRENDKEDDGEEFFPDERSTTSSDLQTPQIEGGLPSAPTSQLETLISRTRHHD